MASKTDHERQAVHNQDVMMLLEANPANGDWAIILKFYTAHQLLRAHIAGTGQGLGDDFGYGRIKKFILGDKTVAVDVSDAVAEAFDKFLELSMTYRYHCQWPNVPASEVAYAEQWFQTIRTYVGA